MKITKIIRKYPKTILTAGAIASSAIGINVSMTNENFRENISKITPYEEVYINKPNVYSKFHNNYSPTDKIEMQIDDSIFFMDLNRKKLSYPKVKILKGKNTNLKFKENLYTKNLYHIKGTWNNKETNLKFNPNVIWSGYIKGSFNNKPVDIEIYENLFNIARNNYTYRGIINDKKVDFIYRDYLLNGANIEGSFNNKNVKVQYTEIKEFLKESKRMQAELDLNQEELDDFLFLQTIIQMYHAQ